MTTSSGINQDIQNLSNAYRGNPGALMEKYQQNQQLFDLLVLQKIKSDKETAARQLQLQMAQKQAASGESAMTVAQQREKEVLDLTKNELAGQQGKLLEQQQGEQQAAMQKLLSGIAAAPGAQNAAAPQAMAAGGIVAFEGGGSVDSELTRAEQEYKKALDTFRGFGGAQRQRDPEGFNKAQQSLEEARQRRDALFGSWQEEQGPDNRAVTGRTTGAALAKPPSGIAAIPTPAASSSSAAPAPVSTGAYRDEGLGGNRATNKDVRVPPPPPPPPAARRAAAPTGIAAVVPPAPAPASAPSVAMPAGLEAAITGALGMDLDAGQDAQQKRAQAAFGMSPEEKALIAENRAKTAEMTSARFDPEKQRGERLTQFLLGMGGQSTGLGALGAGGTSAVNYRRSMEDTERNEKLGLMQLQLADLEKERGIRGEIYKGGLEGRKQDSQLKQQGMVSGASVFSTAQTAQTALTRLASENRWADLKAETDRLQARATQAAAAASREDNAANRYNANVTRVLAEIANATNDVAKMYKDRFGVLDNQNPSDPKVKQARQDLMTQYENEVEQRTKALKDQAKRLDEGYFGGGARGAAGASGAPSSGIRVLGVR